MTLLRVLTEDEIAEIEGENSRGKDLADQEREGSNPNVKINEYSGRENIQFIQKQFCAYKVGSLCMSDERKTGDTCPQKEYQVHIDEKGLMFLESPCKGCTFEPYDAIRKTLEERAAQRSGVELTVLQ